MSVTVSEDWQWASVYTHVLETVVWRTTKRQAF